MIISHWYIDLIDSTSSRQEEPMRMTTHLCRPIILNQNQSPGRFTSCRWKVSHGPAPLRTFCSSSQVGVWGVAHLYFVTTQYMNKLNEIIIFCNYHVPECRIRDGVKGIHLTLDRLGRPSGRAFIEMEHEEDVSKALEKHRQYLGPRYVEGLFQTGSPWQRLMVWRKTQFQGPDNRHLFIINKKQSQEHKNSQEHILLSCLSVWSDKRWRWSHPEESHPASRSWWRGAAQRAPLHLHWGWHCPLLFRYTVLLQYGTLVSVNSVDLVAKNPK